MTVEINCNDIELHMQSDSRHGLAFFNDLGKNKYTLRRVGNVIHSTQQIKAGGTSFFSPSTTGDYLRVEGVKENFNFIHHGTSGWTIQTWCHLSSTNNTSSTILSNSWNGDSHDGFRFYIDHSTNGSVPTFTTYVNFTSGQGYKSSEIKANSSIPLNTWVHLAVTYEKDTERFAIYVDGQDKTSGQNTWSNTVLLRPAGKSLDIFRDDDAAPNAFHGFLQDLQIVSKPMYTANFTKSDDLLFDRCSPARVNLKIPGRPEYIYFFDGETTKCYRKTNARVFEGGLTLTDEHIAESKEDHDINKASKPVLVYDSCEQCLGIQEFYQVSELGTIIKYGSESTQDVANLEHGAELIDIPSYTITMVTGMIDLDVIQEQADAYPDWIESIDFPTQYTVGGVTCDVYIDDIKSQQQAYPDTPGDISTPKPIYTMRGVGDDGQKLISVSVNMGDVIDTNTMFPGVTIADMSGTKITRREGTSANPAPADSTPYDTTTKTYSPQPFVVVNNAGGFGTIN